MRVHVWKNLKNGRWSIGEATSEGSKGKLIEHRDSVTLARVTFYVSECARKRVIAKGWREVHAWASGELIDTLPNAESEAVTYNPFKASTFVTLAGEPVTSANFAHFNANRQAFVYR